MSKTKVDSTGIDLTDSFAFTGTVTGVGGITEVDQWRVTANFTGDNTPISSNWERVDGRAQSYFGTGMSQSSGVFTFPSTGFWLVRFTLAYYANNSANRTDFSIRTTIDNSSFTNVAISHIHGHSSDSGISYQSASTETIIDVTDVSNVKVDFKNNDQDNSNTKLGDTNSNVTFATFIRLGDT